MASIHTEVQNIIKMSTVEEGVEHSVQRKETLQNILSMLDNTSEEEQKTKIQEICKIDQPNTSAVMDSESMKKTVELKVIVEDADNDLNVKENDLVIDGRNNETVVLDVVNEVVDTVVQKQENELADSGVSLDDCASDDLSCTPPHSQIPRRDPYASKRFVFV